MYIQPMNPTLEDTLASIALGMPGATRVLSKFRLDYCCGGKMTLEEACGRKGIKPALVLKALEGAAPDSPMPGDGEPLASVISYVISKHHVFTRAVMEEIHALLERVVIVHGGEHPELLQVRSAFNDFESEMSLHLRKEEEILFPYITKLEEGRRSEASVCFADVQAPIRMMLFDHESAAESLNLMRRLTNDYKLPETACTKYRILFQRLEELETDIHEHMHLENNLLFPRAILLESTEQGREAPHVAH